jgi:hypothetical protein
MAKVIGQPDIYGFLANPDVASEQVLIYKLTGAAGADVVFEEHVHIIQQTLEAFHISRLFRLKRVKHAFGFTSCVNAAFGANLIQGSGQPEARRNHPDGPDNGTAVDINFIARRREPIAARCSDVFNEAVNGDVFFIRKLNHF